ncbi:hypothetical protein SAMN02799624_05572 [Paenibacillus sp. UNC496MF]|uniref:hypothetical protein n=1 Tax=Paenibacillus sp. UNC496MF TaxID=1502753 RepID=UPI0008F36AE9|nr:hypothetical protein [Paenibacillus sp. UNC496MF]SFJ70192.1 hypothetical protein SAMN02799624_05572 [Paenibacillus sp. UNC496MF]
MKMGKRNKLSAVLALSLGAQLLAPVLASAEIKLEGTGSPYAFNVTDPDYGEGYALDVASYDERHELLYRATSETDPAEPFTIAVDPYTWVPNFDLDDPHPVTFEVKTVPVAGGDPVDEATYTWSMMSTVRVAVNVPESLLPGFSVTVTAKSGASVVLKPGDAGVAYDAAGGRLTFAADLADPGPYAIQANADGRPYAAAVVKPDDRNRSIRETKAEPGNAVHSYFDVQAGVLYPYVVNDRVPLAGLDAPETARRSPSTTLTTRRPRSICRKGSVSASTAGRTTKSASARTGRSISATAIIPLTAWTGSRMP